MVSVGPCSINQIEKGDMIGKSMSLLAIDAFSEIDVIEDDLFLGFIYLVDYSDTSRLCLSRNLPVRRRVSALGRGSPQAPGLDASLAVSFSN
jgi:hypothetical protein